MNSLLLEVLLPFIRKLEFPRKLGLCDRLFGRSLEKLGTTFISTGCGLEWKLDLRNCTDRWIVYGYYDPAFLPWAKKTLPLDGVVVDSGANIGQMTMYLGQYAPNGHVFAFEPGRNQADWLEECVAKNRSQLRSVQICRVGLGEARGPAFLYSNGESTLHGGQSRISKETGEAISLVPLGDYLYEADVRTVDIWKLDLEGYEIPALKGAEALLREHKIRALYVELDGDNGIRITNYLNDLGYRAYEFTRWWHRLAPLSKPKEWANALFLAE